VAFAAAEAVCRGPPLRLVYANAWPVYLHAPWAGGTTWDVEGARSVGRDILAEARRCALAAHDCLEITAEVVDGLAGPVLIEGSANAVVTVVGRHGGGEFSSLLLGSTAVQVATYGAGPVVIVPELSLAPASGGPCVVMGVDHGENAQRAIGYAFDEASRRNVPLTAIRAWTLLSDEPAIRAIFPRPRTCRPGSAG
jgi:nucleotide-binding universal stress UspA family protein